MGKVRPYRFFQQLIAVIQIFERAEKGHLLSTDLTGKAQPNHSVQMA